jgi:hypothetical protein
MKKMSKKSKIYNIQGNAPTPPQTKANHKLHIKPSHKDGKHQFPPQISKSRRIKEFGEDIGQLSLGAYVSHLNISVLNLISQKVMSPLKVSHSFMKDWIFFATEMSLVLSHMRITLSKLTPKSFMVCIIHSIWE